MTTSPVLIFHADDNPSFLRLLQIVMEDVIPSFQIKFFSNGEELLAGLEELDTKHQLVPNLILLDENMPRKNGIETLKELKGNSLYEKVPVLLFSSLAEEEMKNMLGENGASAYLEKPRSYEEMVTLIQELDGHWAKIFVA